MECVRCDGEAGPGRKICKPCADKLYARRKAKAQEGNYCPNCSALKDRSDRTLCKNCRELVKLNNYTRRDRYKKEVIILLGGKCSCNDPTCFHEDKPCNITDTRVLSVDHTKGDGKEDREGFAGAAIWLRYLRRLKRHDHGLRLLCLNCHNIDSSKKASERIKMAWQKRKQKTK